MNSSSLIRRGAFLMRRLCAQTLGGVLAAFAALAVFALIFTFAATARAARVEGIFVNAQGSPEGGRRFHFENVLTGDIYITPVHSDGSFGANLPPGRYDLRAQHGVIILTGIRVGAKPVSLGKVRERYPNPIARILERETLFPTLLTSPAPSTAYLYTVDTTVLPPSTIASKPPEEARPIPMPPIELPNGAVQPHTGRAPAIPGTTQPIAPMSGTSPGGSAMTGGMQPGAPAAR